MFLLFSYISAARIMLLYISLEEKVQDWYDTSDQGYVRWLISCLPEPVYSLAIGFMNEMYRKLARVLNDWGKSLNPLALRAAKTGLTFLEIFYLQSIFLKTIEGETLIRSKITTLLQIFCELLLYCQVIF